MRRSAVLLSLVVLTLGLPALAEAQGLLHSLGVITKGGGTFLGALCIWDDNTWTFATTVNDYGTWTNDGKTFYLIGGIPKEEAVAFVLLKVKNSKFKKGYLVGGAPGGDNNSNPGEETVFAAQLKWVDDLICLGKKPAGLPDPSLPSLRELVREPVGGR